MRATGASMLAGAGLCAVAAAALLPATAPLEEAAGLRLLFAVRGPRHPPPQVAVVDLGPPAASAGLPPGRERRPGPRHAEVVRALKAAGAAVIALEMDAGQPPAGDDDAFAAAVREAGNVVVFTRAAPPTGGATRAGEARASAARVDDAPVAVPTAVLAVYAGHAWEDLRRAIGAADPAAARAIGGGGPAALAALRELAGRDPARLGRWRAACARAAWWGEHGRLVHRILDAVAAGDAPRLDWYGPAGTIAAVPLDAVLARDAAARPIAGAAVFGSFAGGAGGGRPAGFPTVFGSSGRADLRREEIAATAFANLLEGRRLHLPRKRLLVPAVAAWGALLGAACCAAGPLLAAGIAAGSAALWVGGAAAAFGASALWVPVVVPGALAPLLALGAGLLLRSRRAPSDPRRNGRAASGASDDPPDAG